MGYDVWLDKPNSRFHDFVPEVLNVSISITQSLKDMS